ncbi:hypothetical protein MRB53_040925 [Persea americana]|nr:hypothetical protein MRB53_040925 [Persea americana]
MDFPTMAVQLAVDAVAGSQDTFTSRVFPKRLGNAQPIAYGGCTAGLAVHSACKTVPNMKHICCIIHGPTKIDRHVICRVMRTRDTKTFSSRRVVAYQTQDDGTERTCLDILVDFHVLEPELFRYSATLARHYGTGPTDPETTASYPELADRLVKLGHLDKKLAAANKKMFAMAEAFFQTRHCLDGVAGQNLMGYAKQVKTTQAHLPITERTSAEWLKTREPLRDEAENAAALAFIMDGGLSFLPLNLNNMTSTTVELAQPWISPCASWFLICLCTNGIYGNERLSLPPTDAAIPSQAVG